MPNPADLARQLVARAFPPDIVARHAREVHAAILRDSPRLRDGNFTSLGNDDLALLFDLYDGRFFDGLVRQLLTATGAPLRFDLSRRLTRSAGLTKRFARRGPGAG